MSTADDEARPPEDDIQLLARNARARAAAVPREDDILSLRQRVTERVDALAETAMEQMREVDALMQRLNELLEARNERP